MTVSWFPYEIRRVGWLCLLLPVSICLFFGVLGASMILAGVEMDTMAHVLTANLELGLALAAGLATAHTIVGETAPDLQATFQTRYRITLLRRLAVGGWRLAVVVGWTALLAFSSAAVLGMFGLWAASGSFAIGQLVWISPLCWFVSVAVLLALATRSRAMAGAVLDILWIFEQNVGIAGLLQATSAESVLVAISNRAPGIDYWSEVRLFVVCLSLAIFVLFLKLFDVQNHASEANHE